MKGLGDFFQSFFYVNEAASLSKNIAEYSIFHFKIPRFSSIFIRCDNLFLN